MDKTARKRVAKNLGNTTVYRASSAGIKKMKCLQKGGAIMFHKIKSIEAKDNYILQVERQRIDFDALVFVMNYRDFGIRI